MLLKIITILSRVMNRFAVFIWLSAVVIFAGAAEAQVKRLQPDFTFRRVTVPNGAGNRITVQVAPSGPSAPSAPQAAGLGGTGQEQAAAKAPQSSGYEWFWQDVSPAIADSSPGRLRTVLSAIQNAPSGKEVAVPRVQTLQDIAQAHGRDILAATVGSDVSPALVLALISIESAGKAQAESHAGAVGLMQLMPATAERFGVTERTNPTENIKGGVAYLSWLMEHFDNDPVLVLAGYNAGEGAVRDHAGVPPYAETRGYVPKVMAAWTVARGLCMTPPELVTDGCVFHVNGS
jgi:soluble lytic murein transglycosylase-like protein